MNILNIEAMDYWKRNNPDIPCWTWEDNRKQINRAEIAMHRMVCSEALANCGHRICNKLNLKTGKYALWIFQKYFASTSMERRVDPYGSVLE